jgi:hypothetical protein
MNEGRGGGLRHFNSIFAPQAAISGLLEAAYVDLNFINFYPCTSYQQSSPNGLGCENLLPLCRGSNIISNFHTLSPLSPEVHWPTSDMGQAFPPRASRLVHQIFKSPILQATLEVVSL